MVFIKESIQCESTLRAAAVMLLLYAVWNVLFLQFRLVLIVAQKILSTPLIIPLSFPVAQIVEHGASNAKIMGSIPRESKSW